jgi:hypothetical protein
MSLITGRDLCQPFNVLRESERGLLLRSIPMAPSPEPTSSPLFADLTDHLEDPKADKLTLNCKIEAK